MKNQTGNSYENVLGGMGLDIKNTGVQVMEFLLNLVMDWNLE